MTEKELRAFKSFLELPEYKQLEFLTNQKLSWWQRLQVRIACRWWKVLRKTNQRLPAITLWESIYKSRF